MKKILVIVFLLLMGRELVHCQQPFKYIIIPIEFSDIGEGLNPYQVSSNLQKILTEKGFNAVFEQAQRPADYCQALIADIEKTSSLFTNKLLVEFKDCQNNLVWSNEGVGRSKDFSEGYAEALKDALGRFTEMPVNNKLVMGGRGETLMYAPEKESASDISVSEPGTAGTTVGTGGGEEGEYQPHELYFNETYFVDFVDNGSDLKKLIILNGSSLGYNKLQEIATLKPSDLPGLFTIEWKNPQGEILNGVARFNDNKLNITLSSEGNPIEISLIKQ